MGTPREMGNFMGDRKLQLRGEIGGYGQLEDRLAIRKWTTPYELNRIGGAK